ncbi:ATP-binding protein [Chromobacterium violaceum]|uniref:ATP-binding protein n=1 Tax=Chromobacterium violaceum TaxID=536 RepID=UPI0009DB652C|nr:ATP-binding protein [Chromobacterium violaceum]OQS51220.1 hypothetical protein B0T48_01535 [Chromobacterium violaceum]OQS53223.1 hypothetical protein B0T49_01535 [Chromobacterium violaceum]QRO34503.1 response regulator [Chromobacterium violaceum]QRQ15693.1 response regulator [Chromobacterium violaceum]
MSFRLKTILGIALIEMIMLGLLLHFGLALLHDTSARELLKRSQIIAELFAQANQNAVLSTDLATLRSAVQQMVASNSVVYARVRDSRDRVLAEAGDPAALAAARPPSPTPEQLENGQLFAVTHDITVGGIRYGQVELGDSAAAHRQLMAQARQDGLLLAVAELLLSALFSIALGIYLTRQLNALQQAAKRMADGDIGYQIPLQGNDELARTARMFNSMSTQLAGNYERMQEALADSAAAGVRLRRNEKLLDAINYLQSLFISKLPAGTLFCYARDILLLHFEAEHGFLCELRERDGEPLLLPLTPPQCPPVELPRDDILRIAVTETQERLLHLQQGARGPFRDDCDFLSLPILHASRVIGSFTLFLSPVARPTPADAIPPVLMNTLSQLILANQDQQALQRADRQLAQQQAQLAAVIDTSIDGIVTLDRTGFIVTANAVAERIFGFPPGMLPGQSVLDLIAPGEQDALMSIVLGDGDAGQLGQLQQLTAARADGSLFPLEMAITRMPELDGICFNMTLRDISARKAAEQELRRAHDQANAANQAKTAFLTTISHEIRTPMNGVLGMLELLQMSRLDEEQQDTLATARESAQLLLRLIDDILDFAKIEADQMEVVYAATPIRPLLQQVHSLYAQAAERKGLRMELEMDDALAGALRVDPLRLRQVLQNFLSNAVKFTATGSVKLRAAVEADDGRRQRLRFDVTDTGIGMDRDQLARLFQPFTQAESDTARHYGGAGLGLSISRRLATLMGGAVELQSELGLGTCASLLLSADIADAADIQPTLPPAPRAVAAHDAPPAVLLVEDNPTNLKLAKLQLEKLGYRVECAEDGAQAFEKWQRGRYQLLLTDCQMPNVDGYQLSRLVRSYEAGNPHRPRIPIIACTANSGEAEQEATAAAGMDGYLLKPLALSELAEMLESKLYPPSAERPAPPLPAHAPPVNLATLSLSCEGNRKLENRLLTEFLLNARHDIARMRAAIASGNLQHLRAISDGLRDSAAIVGAGLISTMAALMAQATREGQMDSAPRLLLLLEGCCRELEQWLTQREESGSLSPG